MNRHRAERLARLLTEEGLEVEFTPAPAWGRGNRVEITAGELTGGFRLLSEGLIVLTEDEALGFRPEGRRRKESPPLQDLTSLADLTEGDHVVHLDHGIGIYRGLIKLTVGSEVNDFLELEYQGGDRLYLPVDRLNLVQKYLGVEGVSPRVERLGGKSWERAKTRVKKAVEKIALELVELYALRRVLPGHHFSPPDPVYREFEATFEYEETPDQLQAIGDVLADMGSEKPMDRLICGDVGYGKTEVAVRAAFKAAMDGKQVAMLVPTTVLAEQHYDTFRQRLAHFPLEVRALSRFKSPAEQKRILADLAQGKVDILIGTHRLLSKDVTFQDLGLVIVDEEQRFGVRQKERLKEWRRTVDVLTLTATPIPRTLQLSLTGLRELSLINTPPENRRAIRTYVCLPEAAVIQSAIRRELDRGGQVFFVHNRVRSLATWARYVQELVPEARVAMAHGQMAEKELERVMVRFWRREVRCPGVHRHHRGRPGYSRGQHHHHQPGPYHGIGPALSAAGPGGTQPGPGLRLSAGPGRGGPEPGGPEAPQGPDGVHRAGLRLQDRHARPPDPGRRQPAGTGPIGPPGGGGLRTLSPTAGGGHSGIQRGTAGGGDAGPGNPSAPGRLSARGLCPRCPAAPGPVPAPVGSPDARDGEANWKRNFLTASGPCLRRGAISWRWSGPNTICGSWGSSVLDMQDSFAVLQFAHPERLDLGRLIGILKKRPETFRLTPDQTLRIQLPETGPVLTRLQNCLKEVETFVNAEGED